MHARQLLRGDPPGRRQYTRVLARGVRRRLLPVQRALARRIGHGANVPPNPDAAALTVRLTYAMVARYVIRPYPGAITYFLAEAEAKATSLDHTPAWRRLALGGFELHELEADHGSIMRPPAVAYIARRLEQALLAPPSAGTAFL